MMAPGLKKKELASRPRVRSQLFFSFSGITHNELFFIFHIGHRPRVSRACMTPRAKNKNKKKSQENHAECKRLTRNLQMQHKNKQLALMLLTVCGLYTKSKPFPFLAQYHGSRAVSGRLDNGPHIQHYFITG